MMEDSDEASDDENLAKMLEHMRAIHHTPLQSDVGIGRGGVHRSQPRPTRDEVLVDERRRAGDRAQEVLLEHRHACTIIHETLSDNKHGELRGRVHGDLSRSD